MTRSRATIMRTAIVAMLTLAIGQAHAETADTRPPYWKSLLRIAALPDGSVSRSDVESSFHVSMQPYVGQPNFPHADHFIVRPPVAGGFTLAVWNERPGLSLFGFQWGGGPADMPAVFFPAPADACVVKEKVGPALAARGWSLAQTITYPDLPFAEVYRKGATGFLRAYYFGPNQCLDYVQIISGVQTHPVMPMLPAVPKPDPMIHPALLKALRAFGEANPGLAQVQSPYAILLEAINRSPRLIGELNADFDEPASDHPISGFGQSETGGQIPIAEFDPATKRIMFAPGALGAGLTEGDLILAIGRAQDHARLPAEVATVQEAMKKRMPVVPNPENGIINVDSFVQAARTEALRVLARGAGRGMLVGWNDYAASQPQGTSMTARIANINYAPFFVASGGQQVGQPQPITTNPAGGPPPALAGMVSPEAWPLYRQGHDAQVRNDLPAALALLDQAISLSPRFFMAYIDRGGVYFRMGRFEPAAADFSKAIALGKPNPTVRFAYKLLGSCYRRLGRPLEAVPIYSEYIDTMGSDDWDGIVQRGEAYAQAHEVTKARQDYERALQLSPDNAHVMGDVTELDLQTADWGQALKDSTRWLALEPGQAIAIKLQAVARSHLR